MESELRKSNKIDLANLDLDYEGFRQLALNPNLSPHERIGFPSSYREGFEEAILEDIFAKLPAIESERGLSVVDIGPGCAGLPHMLIRKCREQEHQLVLVDSEEMLGQLPDVDGTTRKVPGLFPRNADAVLEQSGPVHVLICYSVLHYVFVDTNLFDFVDSIARMLAPQGRALIGDIPNVSKRRRFFASETGQKFHREFTGREEDPQVDFNALAPGKIDDAVLAGMIQRVQAAGLDAYLLPQPADLPMANRRDDLLIIKP